MNEKELEVKFYLHDSRNVTNRLLLAGAKLAHMRTFERNLRFDTPERSLTAQHRVLRLRQDSQVRITYKGPAQADEAVSVRKEIECTVDDFETAQHLLEALGYEISVQYEKYRTTFVYKQLEIVFDEMPYGHFLEIEGPDAESIRQFAIMIGLNWDARIIESYLTIFERLRQKGLQADHLTFDLLAGKSFRASDLGLKPGDV
jgi:adenylate cyclase class 2